MCSMFAVCLHLEFSEKINTVLYTALCHCLKPSIKLLQALKCSMPNFVVMCRAFSLSSASLITALLPLARLNHVAKNLSSS
jgi:hypothetical protein